MCALLCSNCLASPRPHAPPSFLVLPLLFFTPCLTITDCLKEIVFCYAEFLVRLPKRFKLPTSFCFCLTTILACSLFLISGLDFLIGFLTTNLDIRHCTSANLTPVANPRLITGHSFATAFCSVESLTSGLNFGTNKGIRFKSLPGLRLTPAHPVSASVPTAWVICIYVKVLLMRRLMFEFWRDTYCCQDDEFTLELHVYFSRTMPHSAQRPHSAQVITAWLRRHRVRVLDWLYCSPDRSSIENVWRIMKRRIRQWRPRTAEQLKSCIDQEWAKIPLAKLQQLISSVPKRLQSVIKRKVMLPSGKHAFVPTFF